MGYMKRASRYRHATAATTAAVVPITSDHKSETSPPGTNVSESGDAADDDMLEELLEVEKLCEMLRNSEIDVDNSLQDAVLAPCILDNTDFMLSLANLVCMAGGGN